MDRKKFITSIAPIGLVALSKPKDLFITEEINYKIPKYLKLGDIIGITCPAGFLTNEDLLPAKQKFEEWGFQIKLGSTIGTKFGTFAATDAERIKDMQQMLDDPTIMAILCGRGGYGCNRIIDYLDFTKFKKNPKWLIGFSDITLLHTHINTQFGIATLHSKMCNSFLNDWTKAEPLQMSSILSIKESLFGKSKMKYSSKPNINNKLGEATGILVGGNLSIICSAMQTKSSINTNNKILFLEEVEEYLYSIDRMMWILKRSGCLSNLKALIIGGMKYKPAEKPEEEFGETLYNIISNVTKEYNYPICYDFPVGHQKANFALKCNIKHKLKISNENVILKEL